MKEGRASFTLTCHISFCLNNSDRLRRETASQFGGENRGGAAAVKCVQPAGPFAGGFYRGRGEPSVWRAANTPVYYLEWESGVYRRDGANFLQNTRGQEVAN